APVFNKSRFENSGFEVEDLYELILLSAIPVDATPQTIATNPIHKLFLDAQFDLDQARRASQDDPNVFYHPCVATPANWYDETASQSWPTIALKSTDVKPVSAATSPFAKAGGLTLANQSVWKLRPTTANEGTIKASIQQSVTKKSLLINKRISPGI